MKRKCFALMPFASKFREVYDHGIRPAAEDSGFECSRADDAVGPRNIVSDIVESLFTADAVVADLTGENPNVFYELGVVHAIANKTVMICQRTEKSLPFDLAAYRTIFYERTIDGIQNYLRTQLTSTLQKIDSWASKRTNPVQDFRPIYYSTPLGLQADLEQQLRDAKAEIARLQSQVGGKPDVGKMLIVPSGTFPMGSGDSNGNEQPVHEVFTDAFLMDVYPVTNEQFQQFLTENPDWRRENAIARHGNVYYLLDWLDNLYPRGKRMHPVVYVNWLAAVAFCNWRSLHDGLTPCYDALACDFGKSGYRLPTEAENEKAARGGLIGKLFPWGDAINESTANYGNAIGQTTEVGQYPANNFGLYDIAGNAKEWCNDWYDPQYYENSPRKNPPGPRNGQFKVFRGGSWASSERELRCASRAWLLPPNTNPDLGLRCVRRP